MRDVKGPDGDAQLTGALKQVNCSEWSAGRSDVLPTALEFLEISFPSEIAPPSLGLAWLKAQVRTALGLIPSAVGLTPYPFGA